MCWPPLVCAPCMHAFMPYKVASIVEEYFASGDVDEVATSLGDLGAPEMLHYFVKRLLVLALDRKDREREMASSLLSSLYAEVGLRQGKHGSSGDALGKRWGNMLG